MSIRVWCPGCGKDLKAKDELAGKRVKCPSCGQVMLVATSRAATQLEPTFSWGAVPAAPSKGMAIVVTPSVPEGRRLRWPWYAAGAAIGLCLVCSVVFISATLSKDRTPAKDEKEGQAAVAAKALLRREPTAPSSAGVSREILPAYEVAGRRMLNDARIIEVKTEAALGELGAIAQAVIANELGSRPFMVRVFFYFPDEVPRQGIPRYRVEWTASGTRSDDFTEQRKNAGLRY